MATRRAFVLNLDAEYELENPRGYSQGAKQRAQVAVMTRRLDALLSEGDVIVEAGKQPAFQPLVEVNARLTMGFASSGL